MAVSSATDIVNSLIDTISDGVDGDTNRMIDIRTKVIRGLEEIELHKTISNPTMMNLKTSLDPLEFKGLKKSSQSSGDL